jgi:hypothetical protein
MAWLPAAERKPDFEIKLQELREIKAQQIHSA